jgi:hypothetical protein
MTDPKPAPLPAIELDGVTLWPAVVPEESDGYDDDWNRMTTAHLAQLLVALDHPTRAAVLASYLEDDALEQRGRAIIAEDRLRKAEERATRAEALLAEALKLARSGWSSVRFLVPKPSSELAEADEAIARMARIAELEKR